MVCQFLLYNKVNQLYIYMHPHIPSLLHLPPTLPIPPLQVVTKHRADLPVLCGCFPLASYFTFGSVYMSMPLSHFVPAYPSPSPRPHVHSLHLRKTPIFNEAQSALHRVGFYLSHTPTSYLAPLTLAFICFLDFTTFLPAMWIYTCFCFCLCCQLSTPQTH